ncbi:MAG: hypothetical protein ACPGVY_05650 [Mycobacterium sp.]
MTALQDGLNISSVPARSFTAVIREVWRGLITEKSRPVTEKSRPVDEPQLMARGLERC